MAESAPPAIPYFWHVWSWGDIARNLEKQLVDADFGYFGSGVWYHHKKHAMFLWQLDNSELVSMPGVTIKEHRFNVRQHKPRKVKKVIDSAKQSRYVVECKQ